uniref:Large ribosomal subunit protein mL42 n=1 Tax=Amblyomma cajennense TaxID=34607 RepID=A0A023FN39_AMBCJ
MFGCRRLVALRSQLPPLQGRTYTTTKALLKSQSKQRIVLTDDGSTIVMWHPEEEFPYEHTKPLPQIRARLDEANSALKLQHRLEQIEPYYRNERLEIEALTKMTYTTKHRWYPNNKKKYEDPNPPIDREGL